MPASPTYTLSRRERQIMDALYQQGEATVAEVAARMPDGPTYDSVRVTLGILERKGFVRHHQEGPRYRYTPVVPAEKAKHTAVRHLLTTFFAGSPSRAILSLLDMSSERLNQQDLDDIARWLEDARKKAP